MQVGRLTLATFDKYITWKWYKIHSFHQSQTGTHMHSIKWWHCQWPWASHNPQTMQFLQFAMFFISS